MKKHIFVISLLLAGFSTLFAQDEVKKTEFGLQAGYSYDMPKGTDSQVSGYLNGLHFGPVLNLNINEMFGFQTGLLYNYYNTKNKTTPLLNGWWHQTNITLQSVDLPVRFKYTAPVAEDLYAEVFAGPNLNFAISKKTNVEQVADGAVVDNLTVYGDNIYATKDYQIFDLQFGAGAGIRYLNFKLSAEYNWGIFNRTLKDNKTFRANDIKVGLAYYF